MRLPYKISVTPARFLLEGRGELGWRLCGTLAGRVGASLGCHVSAPKLGGRPGASSSFAQGCRLEGAESDPGHRSGRRDDSLALALRRAGQIVELVWVALPFALSALASPSRIRRP